MSGIHHVTAISGNASRNVDFYTRTLGLRLVKKTVNFDDPGTYHLYYGDEQGRPGTILTFFPWEQAAPGRNGDGLAEETAFRVPQESIGYWTQRFIEKGVAHQALDRRFGDPTLAFTDADGQSLALIGIAGAADEPAWSDGTVPAEHAIRGFHGATLMLAKAAPTGAVLTNVLGFREVGREGPLVRYAAGAGGAGDVITIRETGGFLPGRQGRGSVHHIAFRATDDAAQAAMAKKLRAEHGLVPTEQRDRNYFRSVYFREPGGILFEIATDQPGFAVDEPVASLGQALKLPAFLEPHRREIEAALPPIETTERVA
ncbi:MAG TPA: ring-cleaving dioxygenase [Xanthobacteraceae bacterium]|nr:ring-cleaving dioxygenase [Xanthobacteraceae bacterium]